MQNTAPQENPEPQTPNDNAAMASKPDHPDVKILPPMLLLAAIVAGITIDWIIPLNFGHWIGGIGLILLASALGIMFWCRTLFEKAGTNLPPNKPTNAIVTDGPFQYSRNPIYLSFLIGFIGLSLLADAPLMLALSAPLFYVLDQKVIAAEERYLTEKFGEDYTGYQKKVRRWL